MQCVSHNVENLKWNPFVIKKTGFRNDKLVFAISIYSAVSNKMSQFYVHYLKIICLPILLFMKMDIDIVYDYIVEPLCQDLNMYMQINWCFHLRMKCKYLLQKF